MSKKRSEWGRRALVAAVCCAGTAGASAVAVSGSGTGGSIPDGSLAGLLSTIVMPDAGSVASLSISVGVTHTWVGDLVIQLEHGGVVLTLLDQPGLAPYGTNGGGFATNLTAGAPLVFNAAGILAAETIGAGCSADETVGVSVGCMNSLFTPQQSFAYFDGWEIGGRWTLGVFDRYGVDAGALASWTLNADVVPVPEPPSGMLLTVGIAGLLLGRRFTR